MIILRNQKNKSFSALDNTNSAQTEPESSNQKLSSRDLALENMRMQRQLMMNQRTRQKLQAQEIRDRQKMVTSAMKAEEKKDEQDMKNQIKIKKIEQDNSNNEARNVPLYKTRSKPVQPVPMKV